MILLLAVFISHNALIFAKQFGGWLTSGSQVRNEPGNIIQTFEKSSDLLFCLRYKHISDIPDFFWIHLYTFLDDDETQKLPIMKIENAFVWTQAESEFSQILEQLQQVFYMIFFSLDLEIMSST